ncbi:MAG TPA: aldolase/citrate lyase family protein [Xanthobacteraceae bacterium]|jgi:2-keto-3-deoxy-L-rhamnonate aldolase RhmA|nr:aldolase/citrate lyase family protein [Xanthobacteraceae bacterium]
MAKNPARERLSRGEPALGIGLHHARTIDIAAAMTSCGYDWLFIDLEHGTMPLDVAAQISQASLTAGITSIVRVPAGQYSLATRALDGGALGIIMPHIDTAEEARSAVDHLKYPPLGHRSVAGGMPYHGFRSVPIGEAAAQLNAETLVVVMLETPQAIANADAIAAIEGVDVLLVGTNDLLMEMGLPGQFARAEVERAYQTVIDACRKHGKWPGMGGVYTDDLLQKYVSQGMRFVIVGNDRSMLMEAADRRAKLLRSS